MAVKVTHCPSNSSENHLTSQGSTVLLVGNSGSQWFYQFVKVGGNALKSKDGRISMKNDIDL